MMAKSLPPDDWAQRLLKDDFTSRPVVYSGMCYICNDSEFAQMGLPLCYPCEFCGGHVAADNPVCDDCGKEQTGLVAESKKDEINRLNGELAEMERCFDEVNDHLVEYIEGVEWLMYLIKSAKHLLSNARGPESDLIPWEDARRIWLEKVIEERIKQDYSIICETCHHWDNGSGYCSKKQDTTAGDHFCFEYESKRGG